MAVFGPIVQMNLVLVMGIYSLGIDKHQTVLLMLAPQMGFKYTTSIGSSSITTQARKGDLGQDNLSKLGRSWVLSPNPCMIAVTDEENRAQELGT